MAVKLKQFMSYPSQTQLESLMHWMVLLPLTDQTEAWSQIPYGAILQRRRSQLPPDRRDGQAIFTELPNEAGTRISFACVKEGLASFELLTLARRLLTPHLAFQPREIGLCVLGFQPQNTERLAEALIAAVLASAAAMPRYKRNSGVEQRLTNIRLHGTAPSHGFTRTYAEAQGNDLARHLTLLPGNELTPGSYRERVETLAREHGWRLEFLDLKALVKKKAGAFLAVAQGSPEADAGIAHLSYGRSRTASGPALVLVGKGICFDTGGVNLKAANFMRGMHKDMQGSAVALGTLLALTQMKVEFPIHCWLALATNHIGPRAYKPNDIVTALNGTSIEIVHTDAEGRMILADTLALASQGKPRLIIDYATLTGACKNALGNAYSGVLTNRGEFLTRLIDAGRDSGERVWPFPLDEDYDELIDSTIADVKQCAEEGQADHIVAARFLKRFVADGVPWIHIDLSSGTHKGGLAHVPTDVTGFGVRFTLNLLLDQGLLHSP